MNRLRRTATPISKSFSSNGRQSIKVLERKNDYLIISKSKCFRQRKHLSYAFNMKYKYSRTSAKPWTGYFSNIFISNIIYGFAYE